jgi:hypothetical protein
MSSQGIPRQPLNLATALSPHPVAARRVPLPFGLTWADVSAQLPEYGSGGTAWRTHRKSGLHQGGAGSALVTVSYRDPDGRPRRCALFVKHIDDPSRREAARYRYLAARRVPVARLLTAVERAGAEVIVLEFLPQVGIRPEEADEMLAAAAALNVLTETPDTVFPLTPGMEQADFESLVSESLVRLRVDHPMIEPRRWLAAYQRALEAYRRLPLALTHGEFAPQQVGRTEDDELVVFDLETAARRPRFTDVASVLRTLSTYTGRTEPDLFATYLRRLTAAGGDRLDAAGGWSELLLTRIVVLVEALPWMTADQRLSPDDSVRTIAADLAELRLG